MFHQNLTQKYFHHGKKSVIFLVLFQTFRFFFFCQCLFIIFLSKHGK